MNTDEIAELKGDELALTEWVAAFVREIHRLPSGRELEHARLRAEVAAPASTGTTDI